MFVYIYYQATWSTYDNFPTRLSPSLWCLQPKYRPTLSHQISKGRKKHIAWPLLDPRSTGIQWKYSTNWATKPHGLPVTSALTDWAAVPSVQLIDNWAASSEFVSSSIPSWQILTAHAQPFRGAGDLAFCLKVPHDSLLVWASRGGSGETARMRRVAWTFAARIGDKYQIRLTRPNCRSPPF